MIDSDEERIQFFHQIPDSELHRAWRKASDEGRIQR
jgi:hypothetical protein